MIFSTGKILLHGNKLFSETSFRYYKHDIWYLDTEFTACNNNDMYTNTTHYAYDISVDEFIKCCNNGRHCIVNLLLILTQHICLLRK